MLRCKATLRAGTSRFAGVLIIALMFAGACRASTISYTVTGTYPTGVPTSSLTAPGVAFEFDFLIPLPATPTAGNASEFTMSVPVSLTMSGSTLACGTPGVDFFAASVGGGLAIVCSLGSDNMAVDLTGPQLFTGGVSNPTLSAGTFAIPTSGATGISLNSNGSPTFTLLTSQATVTATLPEPGAFWLTLLPLLGGAAIKTAAWASRG